MMGTKTKLFPDKGISLHLTFVLLAIIGCGNKLATAQVVRTGFKIAGQLGKPTIDDTSFKDTVKMSPSLGFSMGAVFSFKVKNRYFLHTEYLFSRKAKTATGKIDPYLKDKTTYNYFEVPILFTMHFKGKLGKDRNFKWYMGAGPNVAYLLSGKGVIESSELLENNISSLQYKIAFSERTDRDHNDIIHYRQVNKLQFGINVGAGLLLEPIAQHKIMVDLRYTFDQTLFAKQNADYLIPHDYDDNLRIRNRGLQLSLMYLLEYNLSKKARNKGKSTLKW